MPGARSAVALGDGLPCGLRHRSARSVAIASYALPLAANNGACGHTPSAITGPLLHAIQHRRGRDMQAFFATCPRWCSL